MVSSLDLPEVYGLAGTILFVTLSLFTSIFDKYCPKGTAYLYQAVAVVGFGQLAYSSTSAETQTRVLLNLLYAAFALANVGGIFVCLLHKKRNAPKILRYAYLFLIVFPANLVVASLYLGYLEPAPLPLFMLPFEVFPFLPSLFVILALGVFVGVLTTYSPKTIARIAVLKARLNSKVSKR